MQSILVTCMWVDFKCQLCDCKILDFHPAYIMLVDIWCFSPYLIMCNGIETFQQQKLQQFEACKLKITVFVLVKLFHR